MLTRWGFGYPHKLVSLAANWQDFPPSFVLHKVCLFLGMEAEEEEEGRWGQQESELHISSAPCFAERMLSPYYSNINTSVLRLTLKSNWVQNWTLNLLNQISRDQGGEQNRQIERKNSERERGREARTGVISPPFPYFPLIHISQLGNRRKTSTQLNGKLLPKLPSVLGTKQTYWSCHAGGWPKLSSNYSEDCTLWQTLNKTIKIHR